MYRHVLAAPSIDVPPGATTWNVHVFGAPLTAATEWTESDAAAPAPPAAPQIAPASTAAPALPYRAP
jgi:hypothetical protein